MKILEGSTHDPGSPCRAALGGWLALIEIYAMLPTTDSLGKEVLQGIKWVYDLEAGPDLEPRLVTESGFALDTCTDGECEY